MTFKVYPFKSHVFVDAIEEIRPDGTEVSHGFFLLNDVDELLLLRDTINAFIENLNLTPPVK